MFSIQPDFCFEQVTLESEIPQLMILILDLFQLGLSGSGASSGNGANDEGGACLAEDFDCFGHHDEIGLDAITALHRQLDDDEDGDIDLAESDDVSTNCHVLKESL